MTQKACTLTELLIVIILIGILASLAIPRFGRSTDKAMELEPRIALSQVQELERLYFLENKTFADSLEKIGFEQETTIVEDPENGIARYSIHIVSADSEDFIAKAQPLIVGLKPYSVTKKGKPKRRFP